MYYIIVRRCTNCWSCGMLWIMTLDRFLFSCLFTILISKDWVKPRGTWASVALLNAIHACCRCAYPLYTSHVIGTVRRGVNVNPLFKWRGYNPQPGGPVFFFWVIGLIAWAYRLVLCFTRHVCILLRSWVYIAYSGACLLNRCETVLSVTAIISSELSPEEYPGKNTWGNVACVVLSARYYASICFSRLR